MKAAELGRNDQAPQNSFRFSNAIMRGSRIQSNKFISNPDAISQAIDWKRQGMPYNRIAAHFNVSPAFLSRQLRARGISGTPSLRAAPSFTSLCLADSCHIIRLYEETHSADKVASQLGYDPQAVRSLLRHMGLLRNTKPFQDLLDRDWLNVIDTEIKAYFLGLIAADGWITKNTISVALKSSDGHLLDEIRQRAFPFIPLQTYPPGFMNVEPSRRLNITCSAWVRSLLAVGITPAKSLSMGDVTSLIPIDVRHHFVRGYFDGDGSISHSVYRNKRKVIVSFRGTRLFLVGLHAATGVPTGGIYPKSGDGIKVLSICGKARMLQLGDYLYKDATIFLSRKRNRFVW